MAKVFPNVYSKPIFDIVWQFGRRFICIYSCHYRQCIRTNITPCNVQQQVHFKAIPFAFTEVVRFRENWLWLTLNFDYINIPYVCFRFRITTYCMQINLIVGCIRLNSAHKSALDINEHSWYEKGDGEWFLCFERSNAAW